MNWHAVAAELDISNGHAARMRYSRFKQQMEDLYGSESTITHPAAKKPSNKGSSAGKTDAKSGSARGAGNPYQKIMSKVAPGGVHKNWKKALGPEDFAPKASKKTEPESTNGTFTLSMPKHEPPSGIFRPPGNGMLAAFPQNMLSAASTHNMEPAYVCPAELGVFQQNQGTQTMPESFLYDNPGTFPKHSQDLDWKPMDYGCCPQPYPLEPMLHAGATMAGENGTSNPARKTKFIHYQPPRSQTDGPDWDLFVKEEQMADGSTEDEEERIKMEEKKFSAST